MRPKPNHVTARTGRYLIQALIIIMLAAGAAQAAARHHHSVSACHRPRHRHRRHRASCPSRRHHRAHAASLPPSANPGAVAPSWPAPATPPLVVTPPQSGNTPPSTGQTPPSTGQTSTTLPGTRGSTSMYTMSMGEPYNAQSSPGVADGVWNTPLANNAPIDPESANLVGIMDQWFPGPMGDRANFTDTNQIRIWIAPIGTPLVKVTLDPGSPWQEGLQQVFNQVPFPAAAQPSTGTDERMAILQPGAGCLWEFWKLYWNTTDDSWHADWGGRTCHIWNDYGAFQNIEDSLGNVLEQSSWGASASGLADYAGAMKVDELAHGTVPHAIAFAIDGAANCSGLWSVPAQRTDGETAPVLDSSGEPTNCIPEGARFRLPPPCPAGTPSTPGVCFNLSDLAADPPIIQEMAAAVQKYGMVDENSTSGGIVGVESAAPGDPPYLVLGADPYTTAIQGEANTPFYGTYSNQSALALFPWTWLELVQMNVSSSPNQTWYTETDPPGPFWPKPLDRRST